ncbi:MAG: V-type ATPase 116kDa subunit family protein [Alkalispirochaeta sp.]
MIFTSRMVYLTAVTLQEYEEAVAQALLRLGLVHFVDLRTVARLIAPEISEELSDKQSAGIQDFSTTARQRIETILTTGGLVPPPVRPDDVAAQTQLTPDEVNRVADKIMGRIEDVREQQRNIQQQINRLEDVQRHMPGVNTAAARELSTMGAGGTYLFVRSGTVPTDQLELLEQKLALFPAVLTVVGREEDSAFVVLVGMKRNQSDLGGLLDAAGFTAREIPAEATAETHETLEASLAKLKGKQGELAKSVVSLVADEQPKLEDAWRSMRVRELMGSIEGSFSETKRATVISGWLPASDRAAVTAALEAATENHIHLEWYEPDQLKHRPKVSKEGLEKDSRKRSRKRPGRVVMPAGLNAPSRLENPRFLKPFQILVTNYGIPAYGTLDPTPAVAIAYLVMFGLMFGDAGHGLVLVLAGLLGLWWTRVHIKPGVPLPKGLAGSIPTLSRLILWCGGASIVMGVMFGSYFGFGWLPPLWFNYHGVVAGHVEVGPVQSLFDVLRITVYFGVAVIGIGLVMNWINLVRQKRWFPLLFDKSGVLGGIIYGAGVVLAADFASTGFRSVPQNPFLLGVVGVASALLFLKAPLEGESKNVMWWVMEWVIELLEVFAGYLANTLSFMRVAGLGIAHVTLGIAFFQIAQMASPEGYNIAAILILILGNVLIILLEGLSAGIQALRLNYYEFFSKHFQPSGVEYHPISLDSTP